VPVLTTDLARSRKYEDSITPLFIDTDDQRYQDTAEELIQIFEEHLGEPKGELEEAINQLTVADTDYKIVQGLAKLLKDECEFETVAPVEPRKIRQRLFEKANDSYPIVRQPTLGDDTRKLEVYSSVADQLGLTLEECYRGMYADLEENKRLVRFGHRISDAYDGADGSTTTTRLTGDSEESYADDKITVDWLLTRYNLALAQAVLYDATEMRVRIWDSFGTVFSYVKLFGLMHRIYPIDSNGNRVANTDVADGYVAILDGAASLFSQTQKYGIRMANFLPALPLCDRWEMEADILDDDGRAARTTLSFQLDDTEELSSHYSPQGEFDSDVERTLFRKWERANTDWNLKREDDVLDLGDEIMIPDFALEHPDGKRAIFEIVGFWTPEYLNEKLEKIRKADHENLILAVSERLDCSEDDFDGIDDRVLWFKSGIHVYDVVELADEFATETITME
jgi:predicted nuclease of restriction endonuclease-like RecB superfamily